RTPLNVGAVAAPSAPALPGQLPRSAGEQNGCACTTLAVMAEAKICGLTDAASLDAAIAGGTRFVGLVFFEKSPRHVSLERAGARAGRARGRAEIVAVTVDADNALLNRLASEVRPDWIQAHGSESLERLANIRSFAGKGVIKALGVATPEDLAAAGAFAP